MSTTATLPPPPTAMRDKLAQLITVRIGSNLPPLRTVEQDADRIAALLATCPVGGLLLFNGHRDETPKTLAQLQSLSSYPLLVGSDIERGVGQQLAGYELFPHAMAFDASGAGAEQAVEQFARLTAATARESGIHVAFAPVADVNVDPRNPIIATRAFGTEPRRVAQLVAAFVRGCRAGGLLATAKHFPGHGNTHEDSHHALPTVPATVEELEACELVPFRAAIAAEVPLVMTAHVQYPALNSSGNPATLSAPILTKLLRNELGFRGAVVSDSLLMEGVKEGFANECDLAVAALRAGVDVLLDVAEPERTLDALEQAVAVGQVKESRVDQAFQRVWQLKQSAFRELAAAHLGAGVGEAEQLAAAIARRAVTCLRGSEVRLSPERSLCAVLVSPYESHLDRSEQPLGAALRERFAKVDYHELRPSAKRSRFANVMAAARQAEQTVVAMIVKPAAWHRFGLLPEQLELVQQLADSSHCVLASLGSPEALRPLTGAATQLCTYSDVSVSQVALADRLVTESADET